MWKDFKKFALKGNVIDLAVAVIIGGAFGKIVNSLVNDIIMPPLGLILGRVNFSELYINLSGNQYGSLSDAEKAGAPTINYGVFLNDIIQFLIIAFSIFIVIKQLDRFKKKEEKIETEKKCPYCVTNIPIKATRCPHCTSVLEE
ncbi:large-conductance mechanosensitive channel protein MscL [Clostridium pasteurianum]|uniref:Large-conductance mechanosensitive channel n=1 Tax=Clostridium pasteurianum BC1 TaxID=86416 RepID=R4KDV0_CLOPA|nr:large-conductance mechanosensitive channel protein MscL [Clostridium pasteurianum]AGK98714.1 large conductance mechanosensitive channel protein [Clostridium pasteurianum BC1]